jgi:hypothetical protein
MTNLRGCSFGITDGRDLMRCALRWVYAGMIYIPSFVKFGTGVRAVLRFCLRYLTGCNAGITDERDF